MSSDLFLHQKSDKLVDNGVAILHEEEIRRSKDFIKFKYFHKEDNQVEKFSGHKRDSEEKFTVKIRSRTATQDEVKSMSLTELVAFCAKRLARLLENVNMSGIFNLEIRVLVNTYVLRPNHRTTTI